jgi:adenosylcobyric acid synthase
MRALMVQGVSSWSGKSLITTGLARALRRRGVDVVPFKAMNMSNNARVVAGGEIGTAQYHQALAAGVEPDVRMNPVLIKPEAENRSQVVLLGRPDLELSRMSWRARSPHLWPAIDQALTELLAEHQLVLIEGAGSPAEINLRDSDLANMRTAATADADVVLVADINRGGAFAHLYGTWALLSEDERARITGFVLNKFRGDASLLAPAPARLQELTAVPTLGVLPWLEHGLPDEDGAATPSAPARGPTIAVVRYPTASNLDEFKPLEQLGVLCWATDPRDVDEAHVVVLPGSKHVAADLAWLHRTGIAQAIRDRASGGRSLLGICGGLQMLGERVEDDAGVDGSAEGLGLLALHTRYDAGKRTEQTVTRFTQLAGPWAALSGLPVSGYQIRHGSSRPTAALTAALPDGLGYVDGPILGIYLHGMFESPALVGALLGEQPARSLEQALDELADAIEEHLDVHALLDTARVRR